MYPSPGGTEIKVSNQVSSPIMEENQNSWDENTPTYVIMQASFSSPPEHHAMMLTSPENPIDFDMTFLSLPQERYMDSWIDWRNQDSMDPHSGDEPQEISRVVDIPTFTPPAPMRRMTPSRTIPNPSAMPAFEISSATRRGLERIPARRGTVGGRTFSAYVTRENNNIKKSSRCLNFASRCGSGLLESWRKLVGYFGPGLVLAIIVHIMYSVALCTTARSFHDSGTTHNTQKYSLALAFPHPSLQKDVCSPISRPNSECQQIEKIVNLTYQCDRTSSEYHEKIEVLEGELKDIRQQCSEKLAEKERKLQKLIQGIVNFRSERFFILKATVYQVLFGTSAGFSVMTYLLRRWFRTL